MGECYMKKAEKIKNILMLIVIIFFIIPLLFVSSVIIIDSLKHPEEIPSFFGWKPFIVLSNSMEPTFEIGDLILVKENDPIHINSVIAYLKDKYVITHRVIDKIYDDGGYYYLTKGDANETNDDYKVYDSEIEGIYRYKIRVLGNVALFLQSTKGIIICFFVFVGLIIIKQQSEMWKLKKKTTKKDTRKNED